MAASPRWKVYNQGEYIASTKDVETAAMIVAGYGDGCEIRDGHTFVVWSEGNEEIPAWESYDNVAIVAHDRVAARHAR